MIADIFYPIFTLTITVLAYFNVEGFTTTSSPRHCPGALGGLQLPSDPQLLSFLAWPKINAPCIIPCPCKIEQPLHKA